MSRKRSSRNPYGLRKQTSPSSTETKPWVPVGHEVPLLQENQPAQPLSLSSQLCLSVILKYVATNILELVGNQAPSSCKVQRAADNEVQHGPLFDDDTNSQVAEMF